MGKVLIIENGELKKYSGDDTHFVIPNGVTRIGEKAFFWCESLTSITIPDSVTHIGDSAFYLCESLKSIPNAATLWAKRISGTPLVV